MKANSAKSAGAVHAGALWRTIVVLGTIGVAIIGSSAMAQAVPSSGSALSTAASGGLVMAAGIFGGASTAYALRRGFAASGIGYRESLLPTGAPESLRSLWESAVRNRRALVGAAMAGALLLGLLGTGLDIGLGARDQVASTEEVRLADSSTDVGDPIGQAQAAAEAAGGDAGTAAGDAVHDATGLDVQGGAAGGYVPGGDPGGSGGGGSSGGGSGGGNDGTTTTTKPKNAAEVACDALETYEGDVSELLETLGIDEDAITDQACDTIEDFLDDLDELLDSLLAPLGGLPSVPVTVPTVPLTVPTVPVVPTTLPPVTVPTVPVVPTTLPPVTVPQLPGL